MKESFTSCFPFEPLAVEDTVSSSELSSVRSERSVNSRSAGVDMMNKRKQRWLPARITRSVTVGNGTRRVGGGQAFNPS